MLFRSVTVAGRVSDLFPNDGYGFIEAEDGQNVYFRKETVAHRQFDKLGVGSRVEAVVIDGDKGPQASTVRLREPA